MVVPNGLPLSNSSTVLFASAVPVNVGVVSFVRLSLLDVPVSESAARSGTDGAAGADVSMAIDMLGDAASAFPAASNAFAVTEYVPSETSEPSVKTQFPLLSAVVVPNELDPANSSTVLLASAVPVRVGVVSLVMLSLFDGPVSEAAARSGVVGGEGAVVSTVMLNAPDADD